MERSRTTGSIPASTTRASPGDALRPGLTETCGWQPVSALRAKIFITTPSGNWSTLALPSAIYGIAAGPDGNVWAVEQSANKIARVMPEGTVTEFTVPTAGSMPFNIAAAADGNLWFTEQATQKIGRVTPTGSFTEYPVSFRPYDVCLGPDGNIWFSEENFATQTDGALGRISTVGALDGYALGVPAAGHRRWSGRQHLAHPDRKPEEKIGRFLTP